MGDQTVKVRTCNLKKTLWSLFMDGVELPQDQSQFEVAVRYILGTSILVFQNLLAKTEYAKHVARKITFSEAAGQDNNTTGEQLLNRLFYWNVHLFAIVSIHGIWEVEDRGYTPSSPPPHQHLNLQKRYEMEPCTRNTSCAMMMINNAIDYVT